MTEYWIAFIAMYLYAGYSVAFACEKEPGKKLEAAFVYLVLILFWPFVIALHSVLSFIDYIRTRND